MPISEEPSCVERTSPALILNGRIFSKQCSMVRTCRSLSCWSPVPELRAAGRRPELAISLPRRGTRLWRFNPEQRKHPATARATPGAGDAVRAPRLGLHDLVRGGGIRRYGHAMTRLHSFTCGAGSISPRRQCCPDLGPARRGHQSKQPCATIGHPKPDRSNQTITELAMQERRLCI
jgi:hypothetical protein